MSFSLFFFKGPVEFRMLNVRELTITTCIYSVETTIQAVDSVEPWK